MNYLVKYILRNDTMFKTTVQGENIKITESFICAIAQSHYYNFNNHISPIDIVNLKLTEIK